MALHPIESVLVDNVAVTKASDRSYEKARNRCRVADANEVRSTDFSGQFGGLYVGSLQANFNIDTSDTTTPDDGVNCIIDFAGNRFKAQPVVTVEPERVITAAGDAAVLTTDQVLLINKTVPATTNVVLPKSADRLLNSPKKIKVVDLAGNASSFPISLVVDAADTAGIDGMSPFVISTDRMSVEINPRPDGTGWYI